MDRADARGRIIAEHVTGEAFFPADDVILAIGQENAFPWIERDLGIEFDKWHMPVVDKVTFQSTRPGVFFGGDAAFGPENIIWAVEHGHQAAISIHNYLQGQPGHRTGRRRRHDAVQHARWACTSGPTATTTTRSSAQKMPHVDCRSASSRSTSRSSWASRRADRAPRSSAA